MAVGLVGEHVEAEASAARWRSAVSPVTRLDAARARMAGPGKILGTPDVLLTLALGVDHGEEGIAAVKAGLDNPIVRRILPTSKRSGSF